MRSIFLYVLCFHFFFFINRKGQGGLRLLTVLTTGEQSNIFQTTGWQMSHGQTTGGVNCNYHFFISFSKPFILLSLSLSLTHTHIHTHTFVMAQSECNERVVHSLYRFLPTLKLSSRNSGGQSRDDLQGQRCDSRD